jgi:hypothetical protein
MCFSLYVIGNPIIPQRKEESELYKKNLMKSKCAGGGGTPDRPPSSLFNKQDIFIQKVIFFYCFIFSF